MEHTEGHEKEPHHHEGQHHDHAQEPHHEEAKKEHPKKKRTLTPQKMLLVGIFGALVVVGLVCLGIVTYGVRNASQSGFVVGSARALRIPIASINNMNIRYADYVMDLQALMKYNSKQGQDTPKEEESDRALSRLMVNRLIEQKAKEQGIVIEDKDIQEATDTLNKQFDSKEALAKEMQDSFGWDLDTFVERIVIPSLREQKLAEKFSSETVAEGDPNAQEQVKARHILFKVENEKDKAKVKAKAQKVLDRIKKGEDFEKLAKEFGSDGTKDQGGDLGWFGRGTMVPEFEEAVFALKPGELGKELVETQFGFHIVRLDEKRTVKDFAAFIDGELSNAKIEIFGNIHNPFEKTNK